MYTIIETTTGKVLFAKYDNEVLENQTAVEQVCDIENPDGKQIYFNFETLNFYIND